ncbi:metallothionein-2-like [Scaptodrosophila lebanonensis]|uniref:Metallothionein-2-like n=1 Tax=Drosophila lebanonensis TaxID=7225 RepID=A0A6J2UD35_DROLE|nr:metallothionein-2-like [Scaptodrosophila lebanonensis]
MGCKGCGNNCKCSSQQCGDNCACNRDCNCVCKNGSKDQCCSKK